MSDNEAPTFEVTITPDRKLVVRTNGVPFTLAHAHAFLLRLERAARTIEREIHAASADDREDREWSHPLDPPPDAPPDSDGMPY